MKAYQIVSGLFRRVVYIYNQVLLKAHMHAIDMLIACDTKNRKVNKNLTAIKKKLPNYNLVFQIYN